MATAASEEAQAMTVEIVPAAPNPDPEQQQQQERDVTAHQYYKKPAAGAADIEWVLSKVKALRARISQLLGPAGPHRVGVDTDDYKRRCLAFLDTEMSITAAFLRTTLSPQQYLDYETMKWLVNCCSLGIDRVYDELREVDPSRHTLLRRVSQCFCRRESDSPFYYTVITHYHFMEPTSTSYRHLLRTSSGLGLNSSQLAEAGALLPLVGIDRPAKKIFRWLSQQGKMDTNLRVVSIVGPMGIGKTTLAVELHNRLRRETSGGRCYFQCSVMAQASVGTDRSIRLLQDILSQISEPAATAWQSYWVLVRLVSECLQDKRYFVIIDDLWEESEWEEIKGAFPNNNHGSRILITTCSRSTAWACCSDSNDGLDVRYVHEMKPLREMDSERLLLAKAVGSVDGCLPNNMKLLCDEI